MFESSSGVWQWLKKTGHLNNIQHLYFNICGSTKLKLSSLQKSQYKCTKFMQQGSPVNMQNANHVNMQNASPVRMI